MSTSQPPEDDRFPWEEDEEPGAGAQDAGTARAAVPTAAVQVTEGPDSIGAEPEVASEDEDAGEAEAGDAVDAEPGGIVAANRPVVPKEYYSISEVCDLVGLKPHVLRYWETQFQLLNPSKNRSGNRVYQRKEIKLILLVKHLLYEEKYTVEGAKAKLEQIRRGRRLQAATALTLDRQMTKLLRFELDQLNNLLTLPPTP